MEKFHVSLSFTSCLQQCLAMLRETGSPLAEQKGLAWSPQAAGGFIPTLLLKQVILPWSIRTIHFLQFGFLGFFFLMGIYNIFYSCTLQFKYIEDSTPRIQLQIAMFHTKKTLCSLVLKFSKWVPKWHLRQKSLKKHASRSRCSFFKLIFSDI